MIKLQAKISWKHEEDGGLTQNPFSGIQPSFSIKNELIMSQVFCLDGNSFMEKGKEYEVEINLPYGENYLDSIEVGMPFNLNIGGRIIAEGIVQKVHPLLNR